MEWVTGVPEEFKTRIRFPMSDREMKRRWSTVQTVMQEQGIDVLIAQNADQYLGGYFRYFTDLPTEQAYPMSVLFPAKGEMTTIATGMVPAWNREQTWCTVFQNFPLYRSV